MLDKIKNLFTNKFPEEECTIQDKREDDIFNSSNWYWCLLQDIDFDDEFTIKKLMPYTCKTKDDGILYGWTDGLNVYDNIERPIHTDTLRVVGIRDKE